MNKTKPSPPLLDIEHLQVHYDGIEAVKGLSFSVNAGELVCLIGCNGAGKTSTLNALSGVVPCKATRALFNQHTDLCTSPPHTRTAMGMALVPEGRGIFTNMSVSENLDLGAYTRSDRLAIQQDKEDMLTRFPRLKERLKQSAGTLSGGEQQMLAIARALMSRPKLLLLDEPSMGLAPLMVERIFEVIQAVHQAGTSVLLVEQNAHIALQIANRAYVLDSGLIDYEGQASELIHDPRIRSTYLGEPVSASDVNESA